MHGRIKITIEGPRGSGKSAIRRAIVEALQEWGVSYKSYDPVYKFKPEQIDFGDAKVVILVKTKTPGTQSSTTSKIETELAVPVK